MPRGEKGCKLVQPERLRQRILKASLQTASNAEVAGRGCGGGSFALGGQTYTPYNPSRFRAPSGMGFEG